MILRRQLWQCLLSFLLISSLSGCAVMFTHSTNAVIRSSDRGVSITCQGSVNNASGTDSVRIRLSNGWDDYIVTATKEGFLPYSAPLIRNRFNNVKLLDAAVPLTAGMYAVNHMGDNQTDPTTETLLPVAWITGTVGWLVLSTGQWWIYPKSHIVPPLFPAPKRKEDESPIVVSKVSMKIPAGSSTRTYYSDFKDYSYRKSFSTTDDKDEIEVENLPVTDRITQSIASFGFTDSSSGMLQSRMTYPRLVCTVTGINLTTVGNDYHLDAKVVVELQDPVSGKTEVKEELNGASSWRILSEKEHQESEMMVDAVCQAIAGFLDYESVHKVLRSYKDRKSTTDSGYPLLSINRSGNAAHNLKEAAAAVVTIKTVSGHGSGSVISNEGYILSNLHVVADQLEDSVEVIYADGSKSKAKVLRHNSVYDLSLLKTSPLHVTPLGYDTLSHIDIGEEVYAIGTPAEIELGQSVSKGIISGKRLVSNLTLIQSDVSINPGNSGGAMVTRDGSLVGIVNAKIVGSGLEGLGFAIPASTINRALNIIVR